MSGLPEDRSDGRRAVVVLCRRTPFGRLRGVFSSIEAHHLLAAVLPAAFHGANLAESDLADVIIGNATGGGGNVARLAALTAGLPVKVPGLTIDRQCASGLDAISLACRLVESEAGAWFIAGGVESCSTAPLRAHRLTSLPGAPDFFSRARFAPETHGDPDAGEAAENVAVAFGIERGRQDRYALRSYSRAAAAFEAMAAEVVPVAGCGRDETARHGMSSKLLSRFPPAFTDHGSVTAGNSCADADGAVVAVVTSLARARTAGFNTVLEFHGSASAGGPPALFGTAGAYAVLKLLERLQLNRNAVSTWEFNEAFAAQVLACTQLIGVAPERFNLHGGALAYGHPYGASGAMLVANLLRQSAMPGGQDYDGGWSVAAVSAAGGVGTAAAFRAVRLQ
ncbi:thiolase family protein [Arthrobacter tumbae]|nr:thiolase family protein [Arthrobacter tumbae]MBM7783081.1 acetyl-CoA C-acetyltransferase [Arthrobacter tumbae]